MVYVLIALFVVLPILELFSSCRSPAGSGSFLRSLIVAFSVGGVAGQVRGPRGALAQQHRPG
jgi:hypothetical protein